MAEITFLLVLLAIPALLVYIFIYMPIRWCVRKFRTVSEPPAEKVRPAPKPKQQFLITFSTPSQENKPTPHQPKEERQKPPINPKYLPLDVTDEMVFMWVKIDEEEYNLVFFPADEVKNMAFFCKRGTWYQKKRLYEWGEKTNIADWCYAYGLREEYHWAYDDSSKTYQANKTAYPPMMKALEGNNIGVMKISEDIPYFYSDHHLLSVGEVVLTVYLGSKADEQRAEQQRLDEIEKQREREKAEAEERERIKRKIKERQRKRDLEKQVRQEMLDSGELYGEQTKRPSIPREVVDAVYKRDGGRCVYCGSVENLHLDHIIPFSRGGATNVENLQLLCQKCNLEKSNKIG